MAVRQSIGTAATSNLEPLIAKESKTKKIIPREKQENKYLGSTNVPITSGIDDIDVDISIGKTERT